MKESASKFISSVHDTGGEFALCGNFTKEFFERLGFPTAVVTGCPSLYQLGRDMQISGEKVDIDSFSPILNGAPHNHKKYMSDYPKAVFVDQEVFWREELDPEFFENELTDNQYLRMLIRQHGYHTTKYLLVDRIKLFPDMNTWREFIRKNQYSCSFGSRIHGSIMPIPAGIPAILECRDARTREMAEFFNIPFIFPEENHQSLYDLYMDADYTEFNKGFAVRFDYYEDFLRKCGIVDQVNPNNQFFSKSESAFVTNANRKRKNQLLKSLTERNANWNGYSNLLSIKRRIASAFIK